MVGGSELGAPLPPGCPMGMTLPQQGLGDPSDPTSPPVVKLPLQSHLPGFENRGFLPELFPQGYDDDLLELTINPEMLRLHKMLLQTERMQLSHSVMHNRQGGGNGKAWHGHGDRWAVPTPEDPEGSHCVEGNLVRTCWYALQACACATETCNPG
eukprot:COSAG04_NODE_831_length_10013_cov_78.138894_11_plen_155_part_00